MIVVKRNGLEQEFDSSKITNAIEKANNSVEGNKRIGKDELKKVLSDVKKSLKGFSVVNVEIIQDKVETALMSNGYFELSKSYIIFRDEKKKTKKFTSTEEQIISVVNGANEELKGDNANKNIMFYGTQRDYIAGITCKSIAKKILPKEIIEAHNKGLIHYHDLDYSPLQRFTNCSLVDLDTMLTEGFDLNTTHIETPKSFKTACTLASQVAAAVASSQYGGQTHSWAHISKYVDVSRKKIEKKYKERFDKMGVTLPEKNLKKLVEEELKDEIKDGVQTYMYQILTLFTTNGQTPFISNVLWINEVNTEQEQNDLAMVIEEVLKQRIAGFKDANGNVLSQIFPKLLYVLDYNNTEKGQKFYYLTELAAKCTAIRMNPDYVSAKKTREIKSGLCYCSMGCRSLLAPVWREVEYTGLDTMLNWEVLNSPNKNYVSQSLTPRTLNDLLSEVGTGSFPEGKIAVNMRGNTAWVLSIDNTDGNVKVLVKQPKIYGRFNMGVVTVNLPYIALESKQKNRDFWEMLDERLELCHEALMTRYNTVIGAKACYAPILWCSGNFARLDKNEVLSRHFELFDKENASISLGYAGLYETCMALIGKSNTTSEGKSLSIKILNYMNKKCDEWKKLNECGNGKPLGYSIYGTPEENLTYKFATALKRDFGFIENITDKDYIVNSYHVSPKEQIDAIKKLTIEGKYLSLSSGGAVSYVECPNMTKNIDAVLGLIRVIYDTIIYAELNTKLDTCFECGFQGEFEMKKTNSLKYEFVCPNCKNADGDKQNVVRRICGYLGTVNSNNANQGRLNDIYDRVIHVDVNEK